MVKPLSATTASKLNFYYIVYLGTRFAHQAQDVWDLGPVSSVQ